MYAYAFLEYTSVDILSRVCLPRVYLCRQRVYVCKSRKVYSLYARESIPLYTHSIPLQESLSHMCTQSTPVCYTES